MRTIFVIALRYLLSSRGSTLVVSGVALLGVALGVSAVLLTMAVFAGFQHALKDKILASSPHVVVSLITEKDVRDVRSVIQKVKGVKSVKFVTVYQALLSYNGRIQSITVKGMEPDDIRSMEKFLVKGKLEKGLLLGEGVADVLGVKTGDKVVLVSPMGIRTPLGFLPKTATFEVAGIFKTGTFEQDYLTVILPLQEAQRFFGEGWQMRGFEVYLYDPYKADEIKRNISDMLQGSAIVRSWMDLNAPLFNALQLEKVGLFFVLLLMVVVASFNITSLLFMKVKEKTKDIAVLRTYGLKSRQVLAIFILQGLMIGSAGTVLGLLLSVVGAYFINEYRLIRVPADVYMMDHVPAYFEVRDVLWTLLGSLMLSVVSSILPSYRASRLSIVEVLRSE